MKEKNEPIYLEEHTKSNPDQSIKIDDLSSQPKKPRRPRTVRAGRPKDMNSTEVPFDLRVISKLIDEQGMNLRDLYDGLKAYCDFISKEDPAYKDQIITYSGFAQLFSTKRGFSADLFAKLIGILGYQIIIAPLDASATFKRQDIELPIPENEKTDAVKLVYTERTVQAEVTDSASVSVRYTEKAILKRESVVLPRKIKFHPGARKKKNET